MHLSYKRRNRSFNFKCCIDKKSCQSHGLKEPEFFVCDTICLYLSLLPVKILINGAEKKFVFVLRRGFKEALYIFTHTNS